MQTHFIKGVRYQRVKYDQIFGPNIAGYETRVVRNARTPGVMPPYGDSSECPKWRLIQIFREPGAYTIGLYAPSEFIMATLANIS